MDATPITSQALHALALDTYSKAQLRPFVYPIDSLDTAKRAARKMHADAHAALQAPRQARPTLRVVIPSMEYGDAELQTSARSYHSSRALWNLLAVARDPNQKVVLVQGPALPMEVEVFYLSLLPAANACEAVDRAAERTFCSDRWATVTASAKSCSRIPICWTPSQAL